MGRLLSVQVSTSPRRGRILRWKILMLVLLFALLQQQRSFWQYRSALADKFAPTKFFTAQQVAWSSNTTSFLQEDILAHRADWKPLGGGFEGNTFTFENNVIKTFAFDQSPMRNCLSHDLLTGTGRWPSEIPAQLSFGGTWTHTGTNFTRRLDTKQQTPSGFLPVKAFFQAAPEVNTAPEWHLVTPLVRNGDWLSFARSLHTQRLTYDELDRSYRPSFHALLQTLSRLHNTGFCHDDIKPQNIFVDEPTIWFLGDLGNVRHISHPYHTSRIWREQRQLPDCRANDAARLLGSYLQFLRTACGDREAFDRDFFERGTTLSQLFWRIMDDAAQTSAERIRLLSLTLTKQSERRLQPLSTTRAPSKHSSTLSGLSLLPRDLYLAHLVKKELKRSLPEGNARKWALTWLFDIPLSKC